MRRSPAGNRDGRPFYQDVTSSSIIEFLADYQLHEAATAVRSDLLTKYIEQQNRQGFLKRWNVVIMQHPDDGNSTVDLGLQQRGKPDPARPHGHPRSRPRQRQGDRLHDRPSSDLPQSVGEIRAMAAGTSDKDLLKVREDIVGDVGLLCLYPISKDSKPRQNTPVTAFDGASIWRPASTFWVWRSSSPPLTARRWSQLHGSPQPRAGTRGTGGDRRGDRRARPGRRAGRRERGGHPWAGGRRRMTGPSDDSHQAFALLAEGRRAGGLHVRESDVAVASGPVLHALEGTQRLLLVPLTADDQAVTDEGSRGVILRPRDLDDAGTLRRFQTVVCELSELNSAFETFCDEILEDLSEAPSNPPASCVAVLERWRDLLEPRSSRLLGANALSGLLAELHFLEKLVSFGGAAGALDLWMGPGGARFDFMGRGSAVEVKATTSRDSFSVGIHGLLQLDPPSETQLYLYAERLERVPAGDDSVQDALDRLVTSGIPRQGLLAHVAQLGVLPADMASYQTIRFRQLAHRAFRVEPGFPRLIAGELSDPTMADRVTKVSYSIDLSDVANIPGHVPDLDLVMSTLIAP